MEVAFSERQSKLSFVGGKRLFVDKAFSIIKIKVFYDDFKL